jgi:hypothetical protein
MTIEAGIEQKHAFVLQVDAVRRLWKILADEIAPPSATITCGDKTERTFASVDNLVDFENSPARHIVRLHLSARTDDWTRRAGVTFGGYVPITGSVSGDGEEIIGMRDKLDDVISGTKPWFNRLSKVDFFWVALVPVWLGLMVLGAITPEREEAVPISRAMFVVVGGPALLAGMIWGLNRLRKWAFPIATFAIGQGIARHEHLEKIRWTAMVGLLVSIAGSVIVTFLL